ncbi:MAG: dihydroorotate dehydrogenase [Candidatus Lernaella stagnicola]|nr:dihydroorotate dehydrogenase [Candidatus Lernaella stagnicola]
MSEPDLRVDLGRGLLLKTPVMAASGTYGYGVEYEDLTDLAAVGAIVVKGLSPEPRRGNPTPRIVETPCGLLNSIGLENPGVERFLEHKYKRLVEHGATIIANVYGESEDDYLRVVERLSSPEAEHVLGLELNVSCPNVKAGGVVFGTDADVLGRLVQRVRQATDKHLMVKLTPNVTDIVSLAKVAAEAGADSLSAINTLLGIAVDLQTRGAMLGNVTGGLSGPAIKPVALRMAWQVAQAVDVPVVGIGGIATGEDALEYVLVGCHAVQVGTANFVDPRSPIRIAAEMALWLKTEGLPNLAALRGTFRATP